MIIVFSGLSVDFSLHYSIMYKLSGHSDRVQSVRHSISSMAAPVTMAAFTTFTAGCCLFPARSGSRMSHSKLKKLWDPLCLLIGLALLQFFNIYDLQSDFKRVNIF